MKKKDEIKVCLVGSSGGHLTHLYLPNFISTRYDSQKVSLSGQKAVFLYPKTELEQVETLKKHLERVKKVADCPVILVLEQITARQKEYLLREKIAFICV